MRVDDFSMTDPPVAVRPAAAMMLRPAMLPWPQ